MDINNPLRLNQFNSRMNMKTENHKNNKTKQNLAIYKNIR